MKRFAKQSAFTLIELMISIAIVVVLMLGITKVFSLTSQTAGATNQMSSSLRDARAAQAEMAEDFSTAVTDGSPFMIIHWETTPAFRNKADRDSDHDWNAAGNQTAQWNQMLTIDVNGNNIDNDSAGELIAPTTYNYRNHRVDSISFFTRHRFEKQTGGVGNSRELISQMNANEAWVWYGHLWLPGNNAATPWPAPVNINTPSATFPGQWDTVIGGDPIASNPYNYFASDWILGREAILLQQPKYFVDAPPPGTTKSASYGPWNLPSQAAGGTEKGIQDLAYAPQQFFYHLNNVGYELSPFQAGTPDVAAVNAAGVANTATSTTTSTITPGTVHLEDARYDLAGTSIDAYRIYLLNYIKANPAAAWWRSIMCDDCIQLPSSGPNYTNTGFTGGRFKASPFANGINSQQLAMQAPIFLRGCTQFIVEYAGDYVAQDTNQYLSTGAANPTFGQITNAYFNSDPTTPSTDGQTDFVVVWNDMNKNGVVDPGELQRQIRWYGLPRDVNGDGVVLGWNNGGRKTNELVDVVPLRDVLFTVKNSTANKAAGASADVSNTLQTQMGSPIQSAPFERVVPVPPASGDYAQDLSYGTTCTCAWGPTDPKPKMIRITMTLDDPNGKLPDGQTYQFVFTLP